MNQINFFDIYKEEEKKANKKSKKEKLKKYSPLILIVVIIVAFLGFEYNLYSQQEELKKDISSLEKSINKPSFKEEYEEVNKLEQKVTKLEENINKAIPTIEKISKDFYCSSQMIITVISQIPRNTYLEKIAINDFSININAITSQYNSAAQYLYNLKTSNNFIKSAFIPRISEDESDYKYSINIEIDKEKLDGDFDEKIK